jgi:hypothetical protein
VVAVAAGRWWGSLRGISDRKTDKGVKSALIIFDIVRSGGCCSGGEVVGFATWHLRPPFPLLCVTWRGHAKQSVVFLNSWG